MKTLLENWILHDTDALIIFNNNAKVVYTNYAGEYLLSFVSPKEVYNTIIGYAPTSPDFRYVKHEFVFGEFVYDYALIGYDNYDEIGVKFYKRLTEKSCKVQLILEPINLYLVIDLARTYVFIDKDVTFVDEFDPDVANILFNQEVVVEIFKLLYSALKNNSIIKTVVKIRIGEYIIIDHKKHKLLEITLFAKDIQRIHINYENIKVEFLPDKISVLFPFITQ
ncbi:MAG: hypothetical protein GXO40_04035 [Epsilonproteobacteria bacterium]|nr:hypothetical protein [Campylobacterota bacterium]